MVRTISFRLSNSECSCPALPDSDLESMMDPEETDRDRLLSAIAISFYIVGVGVSATALDSSLSTGITPSPPESSPSSGLSLHLLLYLLLESILSLFGISLDGYGSTVSNVPTFSVQMVMDIVRLAHQYRFLVVVGLVMVTVIGIGLKHRQRIGHTNVFVPSDAVESTAESSTRTTDEWMRASPSNTIARAWIEMVRHIEVDNSHSRTLREWESAAIETGLDPAAVRTITETFAEVRYGTADVTPKRRTTVEQALTELTGEGETKE